VVYVFQAMKNLALLLVVESGGGWLGTARVVSSSLNSVSLKFGEPLHEGAPMSGQRYRMPADGLRDKGCE
jgi:hypothetical protein